MLTTRQPNEESQELIRLFHQTKKTLRIPSHNELTDESTKPVLNKLARYEPNNERSPFSISDAMGVTAHLINVSTAVQSSKYHDTPANQ